MSKILKVKARQVFDSRGNPTVEAEVYIKNNSASAICPSGASTGTFEASKVPVEAPEGQMADALLFLI